MTESIDVDDFRAALSGGTKKAASHTWGEMNKTETAYARELIARQLAGEIQAWKFEAIRFTLAERTTYTPDFIVWLATGEIQIVEVKGKWWDDARVKFKVARDTFPMFTFIVVKKVRGGFAIEE
jgi:hypothetical protein